MLLPAGCVTGLRERIPTVLIDGIQVSVLPFSVVMFPTYAVAPYNTPYYAYIYMLRVLPSSLFSLAVS